MKKFRFCYSAVVWVLLSLIIVLTALGVIKSIISLINSINNPSLSIVSPIILVVINFLLLVFSVSVTVYGRYVIKDGKLYSYFGFIKTSSEVDKIVQITLFKKSNKLVVYFEDAKYTVIVISENCYDEFISALRSINKGILYNSEIDGEDTPKK